MKSVLVVLFSMLIMLGMALPSTAPASNKDKQGRVLSLFAVVQFQNTDCTALSSAGGAPSGNIGKCYSKTECTNFGGVANGNCANGFGVCCVITIDAAAGGTVTRNSTYVASQAFSPTTTTGTTTAGTSTYTVNYVSTDICQLKLSFQTFVNVKATDSFQVTGPAGFNPPVISGTNTGSHMYVETSRSTTATTLAMTLGTSATTRRWNIRVDQIECTNLSKAPSGCTQYFTTLTGTITSYNFVALGNGGATATNELPNQNMVVCVRTNAGSCTIQYKATSGSSAISSFTVGAITASASTMACAVSSLRITRVVPTTTDLAKSGFVCNGIFSGKNADTAAGTVTQKAPFNINHRTDGTANVGGGFSIDYAQQGC